MSKQRIASLADLKDGATVKFQFTDGKRTGSGFLANVKGELMAYENVCRHIPLALDCDDNRFFTIDGGHIICQNHGALYEPLTGLCVRGPCEGESLRRLEIRVVDGVVWLD